MTATQQDPLARLVREAFQLDAGINTAERVPTGDDYNTLYSLIGDLAETLARQNGWVTINEGGWDGSLICHRDRLDDRAGPEYGSWQECYAKEGPFLGLAAPSVLRPSVVPSGDGEYGPEIYFDPLADTDWPEGCWMCGIQEQDKFCGATPNDALSAWEQEQNHPVSSKGA